MKIKTNLRKKPYKIKGKTPNKGRVHYLFRFEWLSSIAEVRGYVDIKDGNVPPIVIPYPPIANVIRGKLHITVQTPDGEEFRGSWVRN